ncbi:MFS transporter [Vulcanisaeta distributa]|uniref:MFS transporter n=1 Tax=Vulcanisaeta distributa TaxID=164451 RepID=UPI0006D266BE|nr:MFS transporter [Vulcanisaeta distributa]
MGVNNRPIEELDALVIKRAYYVLGISIAGLSLVMINWLGLSVMMYDIMTIKKIALNAVYYVVPMATAMIGFAATQLPATFLFSRLGNRISMFLGLLFNGISLVFSTTNSYYTALFLRFLAGMGGLGLYLMPSLLLILGWWSIRGGLTRWVQVVYLSSITILMLLSSLMSIWLTQSVAVYLGLVSIALAILVLLTMKDAVIIKSVSIMAVMNNPDVLMLSIAFSIPWGGTYLGMLPPLTLNVSNYLGIVELTIPLALTPLFYRFRHSLRIERRRVLLYLTMALGVVVIPMGGLTKVQLFIPVIIGFIFTVILLLTLYLVHDLVSPILIAQSTSYLFTVSSIIGSIVSMFMGYVIQYLGILGWVITGILIMTSSLIYRILKITL